MKAKVVLIIIALIIVAIPAAPFIYTAAGNTLFCCPPSPKKILPPEGQCIEQTDYMRANHMNLLLQARDEAIQKTVWKPSAYVQNCMNCHETRRDFCDRCHEYIGAKVECFGCPPSSQLELPTDGECIESSHYMRLNHMKLLMTAMEAAMNEEGYNESHSIGNCEKCHENPEGFCNRCHESVGVEPAYEGSPCSDCHGYP